MGGGTSARRAGRSRLDPVAPEPVQGTEPGAHFGLEWALMLLSKPVTAPNYSIVVSTLLDLDLDHAAATCRIAFYGKVVHQMADVSQHKELRLFRVCTPAVPLQQGLRCALDCCAWSVRMSLCDACCAIRPLRACVHSQRAHCPAQIKMRHGIVDRVQPDGSVVIREMFKKDSDVSRFMHVPVVCENGASGVLLSRFGASGKVKARLDGARPTAGMKVCMTMRKFAFSNSFS